MKNIVVLGGGCIGAAIAWKLQEAGLGKVRFLLPPGGDQEGMAGSATLLAPQLFQARFSDTLSLLSLMHCRNTALDVLSRIGEKTGFSLDRSMKGILLGAYDDHTIRRFSDVAMAQKAEGFESHLLDSLSVRDVEPGLGGDMAGAIFLPGGLTYRTAQLFSALESILNLLNVPVERGVVPLGIETAGGIVRGLRTQKGTLAADEIVVCDHPSSLSLLSQLQIRPPVHNHEVVTLQLAPKRELLARTIHVDGITLTPTQHGLALERERPSEDERDILHVGDLMETTQALVRILPEMAQRPLLESSRKVRIQTHDGAPRVSRESKMAGLHWALGVGP